MPPRRADTYDYWTPLTDDGDALRLAVQLRLDILHEYSKQVRAVFADSFADPFELYGDDPFAATRRAIVRMAAALPTST